MNYITPCLDMYTVYTKSGCPFCDKVKQLLNKEELDIIDCDRYIYENKEQFLEFIKLMTGGISHKTFPIVFYKGDFIGGFTETKTFYEKIQRFL